VIVLLKQIDFMELFSISLGFVLDTPGHSDFFALDICPGLSFEKRF